MFLLLFVIVFLAKKKMANDFGMAKKVRIVVRYNDTKIENSLLNITKFLFLYFYLLNFTTRKTYELRRHYSSLIHRKSPFTTN